MSLIFKSQVRNNVVNKTNPRIGLSLSGGGAKGFAHVGVLKVLDSLGVRIDYISGTSMGAVVGSLYAAGYSGKEIEKIVLDTDFYDVLANEKSRQQGTFFNKSVDKYILTLPVKNGRINVLPKAISTGQKNIYLLRELLKNVASTNDFSKLPIPFMCVATNLESGQIKIFENGDLVSAVMASSAFPSLMDPVKVEDSLYVDGALTINYPSKPLKDKGIDIVIGVDLNQGLATRDKLGSAIDILNQVIDFGIQKETHNQYQYTDINIQPNLQGVTATSYGQKKSILDSGYTAAIKYTEPLSLLPKRDLQMLRAPINNIYTNVYKIDSLNLTNNHIFSKSYVMGKMNLQLPALETYGGINKMIEKLYSTNNYTLINYDISHNANKNILNLAVTEDDTRFFLKFGLHYDEVFKTGLLINITAKRLLFRNSTVSFDAIVGDKPRYYLNYFIDNGYIPGFGVYASGMQLDLRDSNNNIAQRWNWFRNDIFIQSVWRDKFAVGGGFSHDYFESASTGASAFGNPQNFVNPYIFIKSDTQDDKNFATRGFVLAAEGKFLDLFNKYSDNGTFQSKVDTQFNFPLNYLLTFRLSVFGGFTLGDSLSDYYRYRTGGIFDQNLINFTRFAGIKFAENSSENLLTASGAVQVNFLKNYFVTGDFNIANLFHKIVVDDIFNVTQSSAGVTFGYKSPFGPLKLNFTKSLNNNSSAFSVILGHWF